MKKRIIATLLTAVLLLSSLVAYAAGGIETPMVPIQSSFAYIKLDSDTNQVAYINQSVLVNTSITGVNMSGFSAVTVTYAISDGFEYNNDLHVIGMPAGWTVSTPEVIDGRMTFTIKDEEKISSVYSGIDFTFSLKVVADEGKELFVKLLSADLLDGNGSRMNSVSKSEDHNTFVAMPSVPQMDNIGASLRINNTPALRLGALVHKDRHFMTYFENGDYYYSKDNDVIFGMVVIESVKLKGELTAKTSGAKEVIFEEAFSETNTDLMFVYTIDNLSGNTKSYTFRPFVMYRQNGESEYSYSYGEAKERSARSVAEMELLSETNKQKIELLNKFLKK